MIRILYILIICTGIIACHNSKPNNVDDNQPSIPLIKSCKVFSADFVALNPNDSGQLIQKFNFNKKGFVNELVRYGLDGEIVEKFDISGNNSLFPLPSKPQYMDTLITTFDMDSLGVIAQKEVKQYNKEGLLIELSYFDGENKLLKKNTYQYDSLLLITKDIYWDVEMSIPQQVIRYEYEFFKE